MTCSRLYVVTAFVCLLTFLNIARAAAPGAPVEKPKPRLVIVKAVYGDLPDGEKTDVTAKVADMVKDDRLSAKANNDNFGDPVENVTKKLKVDYTIDGKPASKTIAEDDTLVVNARPSKIVIVKAEYGDLPDGEKTDVTSKVTDSLDGNTLSIKASNDLFGDPAEGVSKSLKVTYKFDGKEKTKTVGEDETLTISESGE